MATPPPSSYSRFHKFSLFKYLGGGDACGGLINMCYFYGLTQIYNTSLPLPPSLPHILNCNCCFIISQEQTDNQDTLWRGGGGNKQVNELRGGDMEFLINCNIPFPLWSRIMVWFGLYLRPYDPLCILNLRRQWTYSSPLKNAHVHLWTCSEKHLHSYCLCFLLTNVQPTSQ